LLLTIPTSRGTTPTTNTGALSQALKKHDAFKAELEAKQTAITDMGALATELGVLQYHKVDQINVRHAGTTACWADIMAAAVEREANLKAAAAIQQQLDELWLRIAHESAPLNSALDEFIDQLTQGIFADSAADVEG
jgi:hypothetical protein